MNASDPYKLGHDTIGILKKTGFDYVEFSMSGINSMPGDEFTALTAQLKEQQLPCEVCCSFFPGKIKLTGKDVDLEQIRRYTEMSVARAVALGAEIIVLGSYESKNIPEYMTYKEGYLQFIEVLRFIAGIIGKADIKIGIEPINSEKSNLIVSMEEGLKLVQDTGCDNVKLIADYYQMCKEGESVEILRKAKDHLIHIHLATGQGRLFPNRAEASEFELLFEILRSIVYNGRISIEANSADLAGDSAATIAFLNNLYQK